MSEAQEETDAAEEAAKTIEDRLAELPTRLAGMPLKLEAPRSLIARDEIVETAGRTMGRPTTPLRLLAAALFLCWPVAQKKSGLRYDGDVLGYGAEVYDFLLGHGADQAGILRAGAVALAICTQAFVAQQEAMKAARGNGLAGDMPASESNSTSSNGGGSTLTALALSQQRRPGS